MPAARPAPTHDAARVAAGAPYDAAGAAAVRAAATDLAAALRAGAEDGLEVRRTRRLARRLRTALELFAPCFPASERRLALRDVRRLLDALGERRDRDVALEAVARLREVAGAADRPGLDGWSARLRDERDAADREVAAATADVAGEPFALRIAALAAAAEHGGAVVDDLAAVGHRRDVRALDAVATLRGVVPAAGASGLAPAGPSGGGAPRGVAAAGEPRPGPTP